MCSGFCVKEYASRHYSSTLSPDAQVVLLLISSPSYLWKTAPVITYALECLGKASAQASNMQEHWTGRVMRLGMPGCMMKGRWHRSLPHRHVHGGRSIGGCGTIFAVLGVLSIGGWFKVNERRPGQPWGIPVARRHHNAPAHAPVHQN